MICLSDAVLVVASTALVVMGVSRWQGNMDVSPSTTAPSSVNQPISSASSAAPSSSVNGNNPNANAAEVPDNSQGNVTQTTQAPVVVVENTPTATINVADDSDTASSNNAVVDVPAFGSYTVQSGDSLSLIAETFGTTVRALQEINGINGTLITVGQVLRYPPPAN